MVSEIKKSLFENEMYTQIFSFLNILFGYLKQKMGIYHYKLNFYIGFDLTHAQWRGSRHSIPDNSV